MGHVYVTEIPGGDGLAWQCPYCSLSYPMQDELGHPREGPAKCKRCGSPMDLDSSLEFANERARQVASLPSRQKVKV